MTPQATKTVSYVDNVLGTERLCYWSHVHIAIKCNRSARRAGRKLGTGATSPPAQGTADQLRDVGLRKTQDCGCCELTGKIWSVVSRGPSPPQQRRGGCAMKRKSRSHISRADGVVLVKIAWPTPPRPLQ